MDDLYETMNEIRDRREEQRKPPRVVHWKEILIDIAEQLEIANAIALRRLESERMRRV